MDGWMDGQAPTRPALPRFWTDGTPIGMDWAFPGSAEQDMRDRPAASTTGKKKNEKRKTEEHVDTLDGYYPPTHLAPVVTFIKAECSSGEPDLNL